MQGGRASLTWPEYFGAVFRAYPQRTTLVEAPGLLEVYPHPALIELAKSEKRLTYKHGKARDYWPDLVPGDRKIKIVDMWRVIVGLLDTRISGTAAMLSIPPLHARGWEMKAFEDQLDAVVCAWVAIEVLEGWATPYGDEVSAIWIPVTGSGERDQAPGLPNQMTVGGRFLASGPAGRSTNTPT